VGARLACHPEKPQALWTRRPSDLPNFPCIPLELPEF
jgi:hypothetical protein